MSEALAAGDVLRPLVIGRCALFDALASGGMATVHLGRLLGAAGFGRTVAVKRLHAHYTSDPDFVTMFMDEARIVARIQHPNVVPMVDVIESSRGLFLVMEYVHGESLSKLLRTCRAHGEPIPVQLVSAIMHGVLLGLHAAHETRGADGELLEVVHRDVSPQNVIVGADGVARVLDFGVAKAVGRAQVTREGQIKGKLAYMAPEQMRGQGDRRADVFAAAIVLWEALAGRRFYEGAKDFDIVTRIIEGNFSPPSDIRPDLTHDIDEIVMRGLRRNPAERYQSARDMAFDLERKVGLASPSEVSAWVERLAVDVLRMRAEKVAAMERASYDLAPSESEPPAAIDLPEAGHGSDSKQSTSGVSVQRGSSPHVAALDERTSMSGSYSHSQLSAHTGRTPLESEISPSPEPARRGDLVTVVAVISFCLALALIGAVLGVFSLYARTSAVNAPPVPIASEEPKPRASAEVGSARPLASAEVGSARPRASAESNDASDGAELESSPARPATTSRADGAVSEKPPAAPKRQVAAPAPSTKPVPRTVTTSTEPQAPANRKSCDPPYFVDEQGHRKYKIECMQD